MAKDRSVIERVLRRAPLSVAGIARAAGYSYDALMSWMADRRSPTPEALAAVANALTIHARLLDQLAAELRTEALRKERQV